MLATARHNASDPRTPRTCTLSGPYGGEMTTLSVTTIRSPDQRHAKLRVGGRQKLRNRKGSPEPIPPHVLFTAENTNCARGDTPKAAGIKETQGWGVAH